jgi:hypothetical protein
MRRPTTTPSMTRRETITILLENYVDVESGLRDRQGTGEHIPLMCRPWNKPRLGYPELVRLLTLMETAVPTLRRHVAHRYMGMDSKRELVCPRCRGVMPAWSSVNFHKHGHSNVAVVPRVRRTVPAWVSDERIDQAVAWLDERWSEPGPFLPDELMAKGAAA